MRRPTRPSGTFHGLSDVDLARILAFLRSQPPAHGVGPALHAGPLGRVGLLTGRFAPAAVLVRRHATAAPPPTPPHPRDSLALGRYVARTTCTECHGADLRGGGGTPALVVASAYAPEEFRHFLRTGEAKGGRELPLMSGVARRRFSRFTDAELGALHAYLRTLATPTGAPTVPVAR